MNPSRYCTPTPLRGLGCIKTIQEGPRICIGIALKTDHVTVDRRGTANVTVASLSRHCSRHCRVGEVLLNSLQSTVKLYHDESTAKPCRGTAKLYRGTAKRALVSE